MVSAGLRGDTGGLEKFLWLVLMQSILGKRNWAITGKCYLLYTPFDTNHRTLKKKQVQERNVEAFGSWSGFKMDVSSI